MKHLLPATALLTAIATPALAQRPPSTEQQVQMLQQQLAASQASALSLAQRLDAVERQLQQMVNLEEQNGHRVSVVESNLNQIKSDSDSRMNALEQKVATLSAPPSPPPQTSDDSTQATSPRQAAAAPKPKSETASKSKTGVKSKTETASAASSKDAPSTDESDSGSPGPSDPGEEAYSQGFHQWSDGDYAGAVKSLTNFTARYPNHRRVSWARNLIGRALLDEGQPRAAAEAFLANYRTDPGGGRAQDSLYYLGQSLMKLGQPGQACKAYAELEAVYGAKVRTDIKTMLSKAKTDSNCQ